MRRSAALAAVVVPEIVMTPGAQLDRRPGWTRGCSPPSAATACYFWRRGILRHHRRRHGGAAAAAARTRLVRRRRAVPRHGVASAPRALHHPSTFTIHCASMNVLRFSDLVAQGHVAGKRVFIRADLNVPQDDAGNITEDTRIRASVPGIRDGARRRRRGDGDLAPGPPDRRRVQARGLAGAGRRSAWPSCSAATVPLVRDWVDGVEVAAGPGRAAGELPRQQGREEERRGAGAARWRRCATSSSTTPSAPRTAPRPPPTASRSSRTVACAGPLLAAELDALGKALAQPEAAAGGDRRRLQGLDQAHASCKSLADKVDQLIVGGGIANTFMLAAGLPIGKSLAEPDLVDEAQGRSSTR